MIFTALTVFVGCLIGWNTKQPSSITNIRDRYITTKNRP